MNNIKQIYLNPGLILGFTAKKLSFDETLINNIKNSSLFDLIQEFQEIESEELEETKTNGSLINNMIHTLDIDSIINILIIKGIIIKDLTDDYLNKHYGNLCEYIPRNSTVIVYSDEIEYVGETFIDINQNTDLKSNIIVTPRGNGVFIFKKGNKQRIGIIGNFDNGVINGIGKVEYHIIEFDITQRGGNITTIPARKVVTIYEGNMSKMYPDGEGKYYLFDINIINTEKLYHGNAIINKYYMNWYEFISSNSNYYEYLADVFKYYTYGLFNKFIKFKYCFYEPYKVLNNKMSYNFNDYMLYDGGFSNGKFHGNATINRVNQFNFDLNIFTENLCQYENIKNISITNKNIIDERTVTPSEISVLWNEGLLIKVYYFSIYIRSLNHYTLINNDLEQLFDNNVISYYFSKIYRGNVDDFGFTNIETEFMIYLINVDENNEIYITFEDWNKYHKLYNLFEKANIDHGYDITFNDRYNLSFKYALNTGPFKDALKTGHGTVLYSYSKNKHYLFDGNFKNNLRYGTGTLYRFDSETLYKLDSVSPEPAKEYIRYQGQWLNGVKGGTGYLRWHCIEIYGKFENGDVVSGMMKNHETNTLYVGDLSLFRAKDSRKWIYNPCKNGTGVIYSCIEQPIEIMDNLYNNHVEIYRGKWKDDEKIECSDNEIAITS
jgi:hypothetical protein